MKRRVVITGIGIWTSNAEGAAAFGEALRQGLSGIGEITQLDTGHYACKIAGEIRTLPLSAGEAEHLDRASLLAVHAGRQALEHAGLTPGDGTGLGVVVGTTCGGVLSLEKVSEVLSNGGDKASIPDWRVDEMSFYAATQHVAKLAGATGPVNTVTVACASGAHAVGVGTDYIRAGRSQVVLAGGVDVISRFIYRGFAALNGLGAPPYRAFDKDRCGVVLGEGAGFVVLEDYEHAVSRGATLYAEVLGHSFNNDGAHIVNPNPTGEGIARSFGMALRDAGLTVEEIEHLNAHGTGTIANDSAESAAIKLAFGERTAHLPVASIKPMVGHTSGAAGAVELIAAVLSIQHGFVPPTINLVEPAEDCPLNLSAALRPQPLNVVMSANSGFGGSNAAVVISRPGAVPREGEVSKPPVFEPPRVVVTGLGVLTPGAADVASLESLLLGQVPMPTPSALGLEVAPFDVFARTGLTQTKDSRRMDTFCQYAVVAGHQALAQAGIEGERWAEQLGLVVGSAYACLESNEKFSAGLTRTKVNPVIYQNTVSNAVTGYMCMLMGIRGPVSVFNQGWLSGAASLAYGYDLIRLGRCKAVLAGGVERLCAFTHLTLERARVLEQAGEAGLRPSDGAAFLVLESLESAQARGAKILAEVRGAGFSSAAGQPGGQAVARAIQEALAGVHPDTVFCNLSGFEPLDRQEKAGLKAVLAAQAASLTFLSPKKVLGETLGAAGAVSALLATQLLSRASTLKAGVESLEPEVRTREPWASMKSMESSLVTNLDLDGSCAALSLSAWQS